LAQRGQNGRLVASQQGLRIEPQTGKDGALEQPLRLREDFLIFAVPQLPPDQALLAGNPGQLLAHAVAAIGPFLFCFPFRLLSLYITRGR